MEDHGHEAQAFMEKISEVSQDGDIGSQSNAKGKSEQEETMAASDWAQLEETDNMRTEELVAYMANPGASSQKVLLKLNYVIIACVK